MRRSTISIIITTLLISLSIQCGDDPTGNGGEPELDRIIVTPISAQIEIDSTVQLSAAAYDNYDSLMSDVAFTWTSSDTTVAIVDQNGLVTGVNGPSATIKASAEGIESNGVVFTVLTGAVEVVITPLGVQEDNREDAIATVTAQAVAVGRTAMLSTVVLDSSGNEITEPLPSAWDLEVPGLASIDDDGLITGLSPGVTTVRRVYQNASGEIVSNPITLYVMGEAFSENFNIMSTVDADRGYFISDDDILWQLNYQLATDTTNPGPKAGAFDIVEQGGDNVMIITDPTTAYYANRQILIMTYGSNTYNFEAGWPDTIGIKTPKNWRLEMRFKVIDDPAPYTTAEVFAVFSHYFSGGTSPYYMNYAMGRSRVSVWFGTTMAQGATIPGWGAMPDINYDIWVKTVIEVFENVERTEVYSGSEPTGDWSYSYSMPEYDPAEGFIPGLWFGTFNADTLYVDDIRYLTTEGQ